MATLKEDVDIIQYWDGKILAYGDVRSEVKADRADMLTDMEEYWLDMEPQELELYHIASMSDPRLKTLDFPLVDEAWKEKAKAAFITQYEMNWAPPPESDHSDNTGPSEPEPEPAEASKPPPSMGSFTDFMATVSHLTKKTATETPPATPSPIAQPQKSEAERYLEEPAASMKEDIFVWWGLNEERFPNLARMAAQYLGIPASSAAAERVFSLSGRLYGDLSQNMTARTLEERMFAKVNTGRRNV